MGAHKYQNRKEVYLPPMYLHIDTPMITLHTHTRLHFPPQAWQAYFGLNYVMSCTIQPHLPFSCYFPTCSDRSVTQLSISARWDAPPEPTKHWDQPKSMRRYHDTIRRTSLDYWNTVVSIAFGFRAQRWPASMWLDSILERIKTHASQWRFRSAWSSPEDMFSPW